MCLVFPSDASVVEAARTPWQYLRAGGLVETGGRKSARARPAAMSEAAEESLRQRTWRLLQPGEESLNGLIVHTDLPGPKDLEMHDVTVEVGELIAEGAGLDPDETYVYSGVDDREFASNQHQGRRTEDDEFVWECQQLLRQGSYDLVFYYRAAADHEGILERVREAGYEATGVRGDAAPPEDGETPPSPETEE